MTSIVNLVLTAVVFLSFTEQICATKLTYYWVVFEKDFPRGDEAELATCEGRTLARTGKKFADAIALEGSGYLKDDKTVLNLWSCISDKNPCKPKNGKYSCFGEVSAPMGSQGNKLVPFVSVAANDIDYGTTLFVREFQGKELPNGRKHNGCVRVDDTCSTCKNDWIDFYVLRERNYDYVRQNWKLSNVKITKRSCSVQNYGIN